MIEVREVTCPNCGKTNTDNWPIRVNGKVEEGGCQDCWENDSDSMYWEYVEVLAKLCESEKDNDR